MFSKGDLIVYGKDGVCRVEDIGVPDYVQDPEHSKQYYKLVPIYSTGYIYIPVDTTVAMRPVLTRKEAETLIECIPNIEEADLSGMDTRTLTETYKGALAKQDCECLIKLIKTVQAKALAAENGEGRRPGKTDKEYSKRAQELLYGELAVALGIEPGEVHGYISSRLQPAAANA